MEKKQCMKKCSCCCLIIGLFFLAMAVVMCFINNNEYDWKKGIVESQFLYEKADFAECHSASLAETPEGLIATYFGGTKERFPDVSIYVSRKPKGSDVWQAPEKVAECILAEDPGYWPEAGSVERYPCWNPVLYQIPGGDLLLFYKVGAHPSSWKGRLIRSSDNGHTWSKPDTLPDGIIGPVKNKPEMINGELVCPSSQEGNGWRLFLDITPDYGKTWRQVGPINERAPWLAIQPSILKHKNGDLQMVFRTRNRRVGTTWSSDGGATWSKLDSLELPQNNSGTDAVTLQDGRHLLVYNHVLPDGELAKGARTPLNVALSKDGINWYASLVLEDSPISQYSYPAVIQTADGYVHFLYTWRRERMKYVKVDPKKMQMVKIKNLCWPGHDTPLAVEGAGETRFPIAVCDWMILKRQKESAIPLARIIGCNGIEVDMNSLSNHPTFQSRFKDNPEALQSYKRLAAQSGVKIASVAMSGFYAQSFATRESYIQPVADCIEVMKGLGAKVAFLPLGVNSDLAAHPELYPAVVSRLREVAKMAEEAGVVIGIETNLDAKNEVALLKEIASPAIKIYYNFANAWKNNRDIHQELRILGAENICQIHCTNTDGQWLQNDPQVDMPAIKKTLEEIGYHGYLVMERSRDASQVRNVRGNYTANCTYLKSIFQPE